MNNKVYIVLHEWFNRDENFDTAILGAFKKKSDAIKRMRKERDTLLKESYEITLEIAHKSEYYECCDTDDEFSIADMCDAPWDRITVIEETLA